MYGGEFGFLAKTQPSSVMLAEGSEISVKWRRVKINGISRPLSDPLKQTR